MIMCNLGARYIQKFPTSRTRVIMYRLFFRNANLLFYPVFLNTKNANGLFLAIGYSFFQSHSKYVSYRALNNAPRRRYLTEFRT